MAGALAAGILSFAIQTAVEGNNLASSHSWRLVNTRAVDIAWRVRSLQFFQDVDCKQPIEAIPNATGEAVGSEAIDMTGAEYVFALQTMRGWETADHCGPEACHIGFVWNTGATYDVKCVVMQQGEEGFHASHIELVREDQDGNSISVALWSDIPPGRAKLATYCPPPPAIPRGRADNCAGAGLFQECTAQCDAGFSTVEPRLRCINGAWYAPDCLKLGSMLRLVAQSPDLIKPYWVVLDIKLFADGDCSNVMKWKGDAFSSGEYVIKYANYHPKMAWDNDEKTSWASKAPCEPGTCHIGVRFREPLPDLPQCVRVEHPVGKQYQATKVTVQVLGATGWEELPNTQVQLWPEAHGQEL